MSSYTECAWHTDSKCNVNTVTEQHQLTVPITCQVADSVNRLKLELLSIFTPIQVI